MDIKEFWRQYEVADKEHKKWEKRAEKVLERYRLHKESSGAEVKPSFNILWANTAVLMPSYFSQVPKPDIRRRYRDDDPIAAHGAKLLERGLEFVMDDGDEERDFYSFGVQSVFDYLLPGRTVCKIRYVPTFSRVRKRVELDERMGEDGETRFFKDDEEVDPSDVKIQDGIAFREEEIEEVVDEKVEIERWPWKNFRHQKAKRWKDVGWIDFISYLDREQLRKLFGRKADDIELTVDGTGDETAKDDGFKPTHAEVHEVWFKRERKVNIAVRGVQDRWLKEGGDPLRLQGFYPTPKPLLAVDTNDSLCPIPLFTLYQHQANELDLVTRRISVLMKALKVAGLYAGSEKETLRKLFEADENTMIPVPDWGAIQGAGGVSKLVDWLPVDQVGKVLTALFREREALIAQIQELIGVADIQRGSTDPRETKGAQVLKSQFAARRQISPKQDVERYFRGVLRIAAEIIAEHFDASTIERMTGLPCPPEIREFLQNELQRQYRIDIETDSTIAPDEEKEQANMAKALEAVTAYVQAIGPLAQQGVVDGRAAVQLLKVYLRKFKWGREIEETLEQIERNPPPPKPDPEMQKAQMEMQLEQRKAQLEQQKLMMEMQAKQKELELKLQELMLKLQVEREKGQIDVEIKAQEAEMKQAEHVLDLQHRKESHEQALVEQKQMADAKAVSVRQGNQKSDSDRRVAR